MIQKKINYRETVTEGGEARRTPTPQRKRKKRRKRIRGKGRDGNHKGKKITEQMIKQIG